MTNTNEIRLGVDIGGTFTDVVLDSHRELFSTKVLTDHEFPEQAILDGMRLVTKDAGIEFKDLQMIIHGTTLATNALIERTGAKTAFITTKGFRDVIEMRTESRFDQYDLNLRLPKPLIPRQHRYPVEGRIDAHGQELQPLDEDRLEQLVETVRDGGFESLAIGFIHSYQNTSHEQRARDIFHRHLPELPVSISCEVSPQMREYQRFSTVCANAYVRPRMAQYLSRLHKRLKTEGANCPVCMIHSAGGLISIDTAKQFPIRLVESGPAGGAIFAAQVSSVFGLDKVISYDMGGTTAKICLIDNHVPQTSRELEVARSHRFCKGSGIPISIPAIQMIEIGAGGGSIATVDSMSRVQIGPESAGSQPGPSCYQRGGKYPTVTDADLITGKIDSAEFAGGNIELELSMQNALQAINQHVATKLSLKHMEAAFSICEIVDENMANATRIHAIERGKDISECVMIAFGGAAPLHAARLCEKLGIDQCIVPPGAGVGSAIGFLKAPFSYESVASRVVRLSEFDADGINSMLSKLIDRALEFVQQGTANELQIHMTGFMRYRGQGWEIPVPLPNRKLNSDDVRTINDLFIQHYTQHFGRAIDGLENIDIEIVSWSVKVSEKPSHHTTHELTVGSAVHFSSRARDVFDPMRNAGVPSQIISRNDLNAGDRVEGPAVIVERETSTVVTSSFDAVLQVDGSILLRTKER